MKKILALFGALLLALPTVAQVPTSPSVFAGRIDALSFAYGAQGQGAALLVGAGGSSAGGTYSITLNYGKASSGGSGFAFYPFSYPVLPSFAIGSGSTYEVVTPSSSSCTTGQANSYQQCSVTATFSFGHGPGDVVRSGDFGLIEALNVAEFTPNIGNIVEIGEKWYAAGGTQATITAITTPYSNVFIEDTAGTFGFRYFTPTATSQSTTAAATAPTLTTTGTGTLTSGAYFVKIAYVDLQGQISQPSIESTQTGTVTNIVVAAPAASAGQVGYIVYLTAAGGSTNTETAYPLLPTNCTLTTLEAVIPACAVTNTGYGQIASNATLTTNPATTTFKPVTAVSTINRTAFSYYPAAQIGAVSGVPAVIMGQPATATGAATYDILSYNFPGVLFAQVGREYKLCGTGHFVYATTATNISLVLYEGPYNNSDVALATLTPATSSQTSGNAVIQFCFNIDITAVSTTASALVHGYQTLNVGTIAAGASTWTDSNVAAITSLPIGTATATAVQLRLTVTASATLGAGGFVLDTFSLQPIH